jgi:hypothetical protein
MFDAFSFIKKHIFIYIGVWGKGVLNGKCSARGPRKLSEAVADWGKSDLNSVLLLLLLLLLGRS